MRVSKCLFRKGSRYVKKSHYEDGKLIYDEAYILDETVEIDDIHRMYEYIKSGAVKAHKETKKDGN